MWRSIKDKLPFLVIGAVVAVLFAAGVFNWDKTEGWVRHFFFRAKGGVQSIGKSPPPGDIPTARTCRENLHRIQAAKRKAAFERGQQVGPITWEEILKRLPDVPQRPLSQVEMQKFIPKCPNGGTYIIGTLEEVPRCSIGGQNTITLEDDHIIRD